MHRLLDADAYAHACDNKRLRVRSLIKGALLTADYPMLIFSAHHTKMNCGLLIFAIAIAVAAAYPQPQLPGKQGRENNPHKLYPHS